MDPRLFLAAGKKEEYSKRKLLRGCHHGQNVTILPILNFWPLHLETHFTSPVKMLVVSDLRSETKASRFESGC